MSAATPLVLAHRGASWDAPENTLPALELAVEQGADYVEFDVRVAPDGQPVLWHDRLPDPPPPALCTLDEALDVLRGRVGIAVEIKERKAVDPAVDTLRRHGVGSGELIVLSFGPRTLEAVRQLRPDVRTVLNRQPRQPAVSAATGCWGVALKDALARPRRLSHAHSLGLATFVFTVNEPTRMRQLAGLGVDGIFTDRPGLLRETLTARLPR
jgi:glycerophosphoryl diester phosphodiesterase